MNRKKPVSQFLPVPVAVGMLRLLVLRALLPVGCQRCRSSRNRGSLVWALALPSQILRLVGFDLAGGSHSGLLVGYDRQWILR